MADGKWVMTEEDMLRVDCTFDGQGKQDIKELPHYGQHKYVDDRDGHAVVKCAFCGSEEIQSGFGGCGEGFGYRSYKCNVCGGSTDFVYKDEIGKYFK